MKKTVKKSFNQKIIIALITVLMLSFAIPNYCHADVGGILVAPIVGLVSLIGDAANDLIAGTLTGGDFKVCYIETDAGQKEFLQKDENKTIDTSEFPTKKLNTKDIKDPAKDVVAVNIGTFGIPDIRVTPLEIFSNKVTLLNANYFTDEYARGIGEEKVSIVKKLKQTIASWYNVFRMISIVSLLSILVYVGIRIILSSTANSKAKYKSMFTDWLVALCLIFFFHYIMVFTMTLVDNITEAISGAGGTKQVNIEIYEGDSVADVGGVPAKFSTNLAGLTRLETESKTALTKITAVMMYIAITGYTLYFVFAYLKRFMTLTFLTLIAPLVSLTYPLDKIKDSKAQAFEFWLKEYIFNAVLPIIHLILYTVFVTAATDLVVDAPLYAIASMAFILPAEKIVKSMFGIKSNISVGKAAATGALASQALSKGAGLVKSFADKRVAGAGQKKPRTAEIPATGSDKPVSQLKGDGLDALGDASLQANAGAVAGAEVAKNSENDNSDSSAPTTTETNDMSSTDTSTSEGSNGANGTDGANGTNGASGASGLGSPSSSGGLSGNVDSLTGFVRPPKLKRSLSSRARGALNLPKGHSWRAVGRGLAKGAVKGAKLYAKGGTVLAAGMIGLGAGMVGDDMGDVVAGAIGGVAAGTAIAKNAGRGMPEKLQERARQRRIKKYGEDGARAIEQNKADRNFILDQKNRQHVIDKFNINTKDSNAGKIIDGYLQDYCAYQKEGVTDMKEMDRMRELQDELQKQGYQGDSARQAVVGAYKSTKNISKEAYGDSSKFDHAVLSKARKLENIKDQDGNQKYSTQQSYDIAKQAVEWGGRIRGY